MKFFKQTKETKRKISFFMALAMVISLLPVSPVVKATATDTSKSPNGEAIVYAVTENGSKEYVTTAITTGGVITDGEKTSATTASVIVGRQKNVDFTELNIFEALKNNAEVDVPASEPLTLASISITKTAEGADVTTKASIVISSIDEELDEELNASNTVTSAAVSSTAVELTAVPAKVSITATGSGIAGNANAVSGAVIFISDIAKNKKIKVAIILDNGEEIEPEPDVPPAKEDVEVTFNKNLEKASYTATATWNDGTANKTEQIELTDNKATVSGSAVIDIKIEPIDKYTFDGEKAVKPIVNGKTATKDTSIATEVYTASVEVAKLSDKTITIAGKAVQKTTPGQEEKDVEITVNSNLTNASYTATWKNGNTNETKPISDGKTTVSGSAVINIKVEPTDKYTFNGEGAVEPKVNNTAIPKDTDTEKEAYTSSVAVADLPENKTITIAGTAVLKSVTPVVKEYPVKITGSIPNARVYGYLNDTEFENGSNVKANEVLYVNIVPDKGYYLDEKNISVTLKSNTAKMDILGLNNWGMYKANVSSFSGETEIVVSGKAEKTIVSNETDVNSNLGYANLDTAVLQDEKLKEELIKAFGENSEAIKEILDNGGTVGLSLIVKEASKEETEKGKDKINSAAAKAVAVGLDITLKAVCKRKDTNETAFEIILNELSNKVKIKISVAGDKGIFGEKHSFKADKEGYTRKYYVIRLHNGILSAAIECTIDNGILVFETDKFSTYVFYYEDVKDKNDNDNNNNNNYPYYPSGGAVSTATPSPSTTPTASATPSATPSASATPGTTASAVPGDGSGSGVTPTKAPEATKTPGSTGNGDKDNDKNTGGTKTSVKVGKKVTVNSSKYKVTSVKSGSRAVQFTKGRKNAKSVVIPGTVKISGKNYKVTSIAKNAFKGNKKLKKVTIGANVNKIGKAAFKGCKNLKSIIVKTKKLTAKKTGANAFKGINKKATFKVPKKKVKAYKKIVKAKGAAKTVKVKK